MFDRYFLDDENYLRNEVEVVDEVREAGNYLFFNILYIMDNFSWFTDKKDNDKWDGLIALSLFAIFLV
jgi:hypothetical protein